MTLTSTSEFEAIGRRAEIADSAHHEVDYDSVDLTQEKFFVDAAKLVSDLQMCDLMPQVLGLDAAAPLEEHAEGQITG